MMSHYGLNNQQCTLSGCILKDINWQINCYVASLSQPHLGLVLVKLGYGLTPYPHLHRSLQNDILYDIL